jgi:hypothetical protein
LLLRVADVFDDVSDFAPDATHRALRLSGDFIHGTFVVQARIVRDVAGRLRSFNLLCPTTRQARSRECDAPGTPRLAFD